MKNNTYEISNSVSHIKSKLWGGGICKQANYDIRILVCEKFQWSISGAIWVEAYSKVRDKVHEKTQTQIENIIRNN